MKFPDFIFDEDAALKEFDRWITPSMGEIKDAEQFPAFFEEIKEGMNLLSRLCNNFDSFASCRAASIAEKFFEQCEDEMVESESLRLFSALMMLTGKTDNNLKCQFPVYLAQTLGDSGFPCIRNGKLAEKAIPRTLGAEAVSSAIANLSGHVIAQKNLIEKYLRVLIGDEPSRRQVWSFGLGYLAALDSDCGDDFLTTLVIFFKRGSITASKGHEPDNLLRERMSEWGMEPDVDYNCQDVAVVDLLGEDVDSRVKKRKYDFILPYKSRDDVSGGQIFIQCQFYAGDSGSVSHKNVDQTTATREATLEKVPNALFVEYIDGAGYYSSLNGDLKRLLHMETTHDFIQVRTSPVKLRRSLQTIGYLTPLEIAQEILRVGTNRDNIVSSLCSQGYDSLEVETAMKTALDSSYLLEKGSDITIESGRIETVRRYCILDCLVVHGKPLSSDNVSGNLIAPGYELYRGLPQNQLVSIVSATYNACGAMWEDFQSAFDDIQWLIDMGFIQGR